MWSLSVNDGFRKLGRKDNSPWRSLHRISGRAVEGLGVCLPPVPSWGERDYPLVWYLFTVFQVHPICSQEISFVACCILIWNWSLSTVQMLKTVHNERKCITVCSILTSGLGVRFISCISKSQWIICITRSCFIKVIYAQSLSGEPVINDFLRKTAILQPHQYQFPTTSH